MTRAKVHLLLTPIAACILAACSDSARAPESVSPLAPAGKGHENASAAATHTYQVTIENLTDGQPFSPGVIVTHTKAATVWEVGGSPSALIVNIAEDGLGPDNLTPQEIADLIENLRETPGVHQVVETAAPIDDRTAPSTLPDGTVVPSERTFTIEARANANRISIAVMLICTNDGFTGVSGVKLPGGFKPAVFETAAYDAGSETNTEAYGDIVDPCQVLGPDAGPPAIPNGNATPPADGNTIVHHPGIAGIAEAMGLDDELHNWEEPVARITVQRIK